MNAVAVAAVVAAGLLIAAAVFQAALAAGLPWGDMSYGGRVATADGVLPNTHRAMSAFAVVVLALAAWIVLARAGLIAPGIFGAGFLRVTAWVIVGYLVVNTMANLAARHPVERYGFGLATAISAAACLIVAQSSTNGI